LARTSAEPGLPSHPLARGALGLAADLPGSLAAGPLALPAAVARHRVTRAEFDALATGNGRRETLVTLRAAQLSKRLLLISMLTEAVRNGPPSTARDCVDEAFRLLAAARRADRPAADRVIMHPPVAAWALRCLRRLRGVIAPAEPLDDDLGYFGGVAAAAATLAHLPYAVPARTRGGELTLPTLGTVLAGDASQWVMVTGAPGGGVTLATPTRTELRGMSATATLWRPAVTTTATTAGEQIDVVVEDADPYRGAGVFVPEPRRPGVARAVSPAAAHAEAWRARLVPAWRVLVEAGDGMAETVRAVTSAIVPLPASWGALASASTADALGAAILAPVDDPVRLASMLVHEARHATLATLLDFAPFLREESEAVYFAPWRRDPRPLGGLLHGAYAFLGIAGFWRERWAAAAGPEAELAAFEFAWCRAAVAEVLGTLRGSGALTELGRQFVAGMAARLDGWRSLTPPPAVADAAGVALADARVRWRLRHARPDDDRIAAWVAEWRAGTHCTQPDPPPVTITPNGDPGAADARRDLARLRFADPPGFGRAISRPGPAVGDPCPATAEGGTLPPAGGQPPAVPTAGDLAFVTGDLRRAAGCYRADLARRADDLSAFAGLALVRASGHGPAARVYRECPEALWALFRDLARAGHADPDEVARWLAYSELAPRGGDAMPRPAAIFVAG